MATERHAKDYDERVAAAGGHDQLTASLIKAVRQVRRAQFISVGGLILLLGICAVLAVTVVRTNRTAKMAVANTQRSAENQRRSLANSKQANEIIRCLTKRKKPGKCLGLTVEPGSPGSQGLRGLSGTPGLSGPRGIPGKDGSDGSDGRAGSNATLEQIAKAVRDYCAQRDSCRGQTGSTGPQAAPAPPTQEQVNEAVRVYCTKNPGPCSTVAAP